MRHRVAVAVWFVVVMSAAIAAHAAQDVVVTTTGDRLVGEIKSVTKDVLTLETDYSDADFKIKWEKIASIESDRQFLLETFDGKRVSGSLKPVPEQKAVVQVADTQVPLPQVSAVQPFERSFWSRFDSGLDFGYSMTRTNSAKQLSLGTNLSYRDEHHVDVLFANVFRNSQANAPETSRWDLGNDFRRLLGSRWYVNTGQDFLNTEEQGLTCARRSVPAPGDTCSARRRSTWRWAAGVAWTNENFTDPAVPNEDSAEAYLGTEFMTEKLKVADVITRFNYYPSLTISGRYRLTYRLDVDFNLPGDWYFRFGLFDNYDSKPAAGFSSNDYGWSNGFGFKF